MKRTLLLALLCIVTAFQLSADLSWGGQWQGGLAADPRDEVFSHSPWQQLDLDMEYRKGDLKFFTSGSFAMDLGTEVYSLEWQECYLDYASLAGRWTIGRQRIHWGQSLALPVLDMVNPADYSLLFQGRGEGDVLPQWSLRWRKDLASMQLEALYQPEFRPARLPENALPQADLPSPGLYTGEGGARLRFFLPAGDFGAAAFYGYDDIPVYKSSLLLVDGVPELAFEGEYKAFWLLGWDAAIPAGPLLIRLENSLSLWKSFTRQTPGADPFYSHQLAGLLGLDWMPSDWIMVLEAVGTYRLHDEADALDDSLTLQCAADLTRSFDAGRWKAGCSAMWDLLEEQIYLNPQLSHYPADGLGIEAGAELLWGESALLEKDQRLVYLRVNYQF